MDERSGMSLDGRSFFGVYSVLQQSPGEQPEKREARERKNAQRNCQSPEPDSATLSSPNGCPGERQTRHEPGKHPSDTREPRSPTEANALKHPSREQCAQDHAEQNQSSELHSARVTRFVSVLRKG